jgi:hypothetical protein
MADKHDKWADTLSAEHSGWLTGFLAEEDKIDRRMMWRLGSWGVAAVGAVVIAILASQSQVQLRRDQVATSETFARQSQQIQFVAKETQAEARRLTLAIETLNSDRDRLYARVTSVEQGLDSVTGSIKRQTIATPTAATPTPAPAPLPPAIASVVAPPAATEPKPAAELPSIPSTPVVGPVAAITPLAETTPAKPAQAVVSSSNSPPASTPLVTWKSMTAPPDAAAAKLSEPAPAVEPPPTAPETTASVQPAAPEPAPAVVEAVATPVARTEFGVDIGGANSVDGLRAIWRGMSKIPHDERTSANHHGQGAPHRTWHATAPRRRPAHRCCSRREDLRRPDREQPALRDVDLRWSAPCCEGRDGARGGCACTSQAGATQARRTQATGTH